MLLSASSLIRAVTFSFLILLLLGLSGCGNNLNTPQGVASEMQRTLREYVATLKSVTDESSAKRMLPKMKSLSARMDQINKAAGKLGKAPLELFDAVKDKKQFEEMDSLFKEFFGQLLRIGADPKLREILGDEMNPMEGN